MLELKLNKKTFHCPESWAECTPEQTKIFLTARRIPVEHRNRIVYESMLKAYLSMTEKAWLKLILSFEQWRLLKDMLHWVFEEIPSQKPFDYFDYQGIRYYLPDESFSNSTAIEVSIGNMKYLDFAKPENPNTAALNELIATFCRPERADLETFKMSSEWNGDLREPYNQTRTEQTAKKLEGLDTPTKVAFLTYFEVMNTAFLEEFEELFGDSKETPRYQDGTGWLMLLKTAAKSPLWGGFEKVCNQPARIVWAFMLDDVLDARQEMAEYEKQKEEMYASRNH